MKRPILLVVCLVMLASILACDAGATTPTVTLIASQTSAPQQPSSTSAAATTAPTEPQATSVATVAPPTDVPTQAQGSFPTPTKLAPTSVGLSRVKIYLVAVGDEGKSGPKIGCGDSMVGVDRDIAPTRAPLQAALNELLSLKDEFYGQSGLRNALYTSNLQIDKVTIDTNGLATINLTGTMSLAGECDDPRFEAQIIYTAKQFSTVKDVKVFINGTPMEDLLGGLK